MDMWQHIESCFRSLQSSVKNCWAQSRRLPGGRCSRARLILAEHFKVRFHFTPTYSSWLNPIELWFANI
jgi:transposase